ncbi:MAG TPA: hypothetical protein DCZ03_10600, partial [Gammaproteobacteria bacterium]|nr:hypothetical protein [Gammaproteobacteria bacterium]
KGAYAPFSFCRIRIWVAKSLIKSKLVGLQRSDRVNFRTKRWYHDFLIGLLLWLCAWTLNAAEAIVEGEHYFLIEPAQETADPDKIEVREYFWYGCPHCYQFEPLLERWVENTPTDVAFRREPAALGKHWVNHAKAYYAAEQLGVLDQVHGALFEAMHVEKQRLSSEKELAKFFAKFGVQRDAFEKAFSSFSVDSQLRKSRAEMLATGATGV